MLHCLPIIRPRSLRSISLLPITNMVVRRASARSATAAASEKAKNGVKQEAMTPRVKKETNATPKSNTSAKRSAEEPASSRSSKRIKVEDDNDDDKENIKMEDEDDSTDTKTTPAKQTAKRSIIDVLKSPSNVKTEDELKASVKKAADLQARKLQMYNKTVGKSPFPDFPHPTPEEAELAHRILASVHGERVRPEKVVASKTSAGCGDSPSVLDALVRTILSQNTSDKNSTRAKLQMDKVYGGSDEWAKIVDGGYDKLRDAIKSGGLAHVKARNIISICEQAKEKYGTYSLDHLFEKSDQEAMTEMLSFQGVGPKTASCVLLFCLQRDSFAVDTHVHRISGLLGWRPKTADRDQTHAHLEVRIPDEDKYGLHILMVTHGKLCDECKAGGKSVGKCKLRKAFRQGKLDGEAGEEVKEEEEAEIKKEGTDADTDGDKGGAGDVEGEDSGLEDFVAGMEGRNKGQKKIRAGPKKTANRSKK